MRSHSLTCPPYDSTFRFNNKIYFPQDFYKWKCTFLVECPIYICVCVYVCVYIYIYSAV